MYKNKSQEKIRAKGRNSSRKKKKKVQEFSKTPKSNLLKTNKREKKNYLLTKHRENKRMPNSHLKRKVEHKRLRKTNLDVRLFVFLVM